MNYDPGQFPDVSGREVGAKWTEPLLEGSTAHYSIPEGNGLNTVDVVIVDATGTVVTRARIVRAVTGPGYRRWQTDANGVGSYFETSDPKLGGYGQHFDVGVSTAGPPTAEFEVGPNWEWVRTPSYDENGNHIGYDVGVRNSDGLYDNIHSDLLGNRWLTLTTRVGLGALDSRLAMQIDHRGDGWFIDGAGKEWTVFTDSSGQLGMHRNFETRAGVYNLRFHHTGVIIAEFTGTNGEWYRDWIKPDGSYTRMMSNLSTISYNRAGRQIGRTTRPDEQPWWAKLLLGSAHFAVGFLSAAGDVIAYPFRRGAYDPMRTMSSIRVTDTGLMTTYQPPNREVRLAEIGSAAISPIIALPRYLGGVLADNMYTLSSVQVTATGLATTYRRPDREARLVTDLTGITPREWSDDPWGGTGAVLTMIAFGFIGPKGGRFSQPRTARGTNAYIERELANHPEVADIVKRLVADAAHPLDLTRDLADPALRAATLRILSELSEGRALRDQPLAEFLQKNPGKGPLFEPILAEVNLMPDGRKRLNVFVDQSKRTDPARAIGTELNNVQRAALVDYGEVLRTKVEPAVEAELARLIRGLNGATTNIRTKRPSGILDKVQRMVRGHGGRDPRPYYRVGDVIDAVGARITVENVQQLTVLLSRVRQHFGTGDNGRILEIENMYATPKKGNPEYRVIPVVIRIDVDGISYTYELQLTTRRASIAADLNHNTIYKPYIELSSSERSSVSRIFAEAAALDQLQASRRSADGNR
ncbi:hypothetical protein NMK54_20505 [Nocardia otitidiscaviarum]|uniref:hypothetical protein n=1 Tax=Nocardia otitidiscaviarum TaxID=1823 RepID=UPI001C8F776B|nr:hypothetical protein [Nocardia otitidiscaviarum]MCP9622533.1 hypothetical protein [Nocardia otitidiscaviarum]